MISERRTRTGAARIVDHTRRRQGGRGRRIGGSQIPQLGWQELVNPYAPMELLSADQLEAIHATSLRILEELGIEFMSARALEVFARAGATVDRGSSTVRLERGLIEQALRSAPERFVLTPRNAQRRVILGGNHISFGLVAGPPNVHDCERGRRAGNFQDYCDFTRLAQYFNIIHLLGNQVCAPIELPANSRHLDTYRANLIYSDRVFHCSAIGAGRALDAVRMTAIARGLTLEQLARSPGLLTIISVNSPRRFDEAMSEGLMAMAEHGQAVVITPFTLMGAMAPVTLAAALRSRMPRRCAAWCWRSWCGPARPSCTVPSRPTSTCAPAPPPSARPKMPRPTSRAASSRAATACPIGPRTPARPMPPTRRVPTRRRCHCGVRSSATAISSTMPPAGRKAD